MLGPQPDSFPKVRNCRASYVARILGKNQTRRGGKVPKFHTRMDVNLGLPEGKRRDAVL